MWEQDREQKPPVYKLDNLAVGLTQLRNENILCDLLIHLEDGSTVWAHKAVVCAVSPYILQLCQAEQSKSQSMMYINLNHINVTNESLHLIVNYMYGCEIVVSSENLQDMRALANVLQLEDLKESLSENFNVEDHDEATQHEKASAYNEASGLSTSIKVEPCEDILDTSNNIISLSPNIERDYNKNNSTNHTDFDIKLNDADDMDDAEADDYDDSVGDIETPTKRRKKSMELYAAGQEIPGVKPTRTNCYTIEYKLQAVEYARPHNISQTAKMFKSNRKCVRSWIQNEAEFRLMMEQGKSYKKRLSGSGQRSHFPQVETILLKWITEQRALANKVTDRHLQEKCRELGEKMDQPVKGSYQWMYRFKIRHRDSLVKLNQGWISYNNTAFINLPKVVDARKSVDPSPGLSCPAINSREHSSSQAFDDRVRSEACEPTLPSVKIKVQSNDYDMT
ncbi:unnamed protein product [Owenia fusiformis]|uniref:BTB domain-containing protein n=1 Tax=Owenia fusiformis TaxID=6347 RepID=A0A8S4PBY2_OWEFU|nr:unnamed protein product [Owenia fusiformis]